MPLAVDAMIYIAFLAFAIKRLMTYLMALQQDDYDNARVLKWMGMHMAFDKRLTAILALVSLAAIPDIMQDFSFALDFLILASFVGFAVLEKDARKHSKKKLVMTQRATRIFFAGFFPLALVGATTFAFTFTWQWILLVQAIPLFLLGGNIALNPYEKSVQKNSGTRRMKKSSRSNPP